MNMVHQRFRRNAGGLRCAMLSALCAFLSFAPFLFRDGGFFHVWADFNSQQIPFGMALHHALDGMNPGGWTWSYELGMSTIQAFSFYGMGSPFYWISLLFPAAWYPYLTGWTYILKYTAAGVAAYYYIRRFTKGENGAAAGALMYAFSAFQATNLMYFHFHDAAALFPLLLTGMEKIMENPRDRGLLVFAVFINALNNYYFFVLEAVFSVIYFVFRSFGMNGRNIRRIFRDAVNILLSSLWGAAMAAILLVPSLVYILQSPRAERSVSLSDWFWDFRRLGFTARGILLPGDTMAYQSAFYESEYDSVAAWLPLAGPGLSLAYLLKNRLKKGTWLSRMIPALLLVSVFPLLSSGFTLFREVTYRWWFMLALLLALASAKVMDTESEYPVNTGLGVYLASVIVFCAAVFIGNTVRPDTGILSDPGRFLVFGIIALAGAALLLLLHHFGKLRSGTAVALVCVFCTGTTFMTLDTYRNFGDFTDQKILLERGMQLETQDPQYRYRVADNQVMLPCGGSGLTVFSSALSRGTREFDSLFSFSSKNHSLDKSLVRGLPELFAGKYRFSSDPGDQEPLQELEENGGILYVLQSDACPIGFAVDHYILREQLLTMEESDRGTALLYAAVIDAEAQESLSGWCTEILPDEIPADADFSGIVARNVENRVRNFERDSRGFRCTTEYAGPKAVWFSVPDDGGWTARIDGEKQEILPSGGMMLLQVPAGRHEIVFTYVTPGYTAGSILTLLSGTAYILYLVLHRIRGKRKTN